MRHKTCRCRNINVESPLLIRHRPEQTNNGTYRYSELAARQASHVPMHAAAARDRRRRRAWCPRARGVCSVLGHVETRVLQRSRHCHARTRPMPARSSSDYQKEKRAPSVQGPPCIQAAAKVNASQTCGAHVSPLFLLRAHVVRTLLPCLLIHSSSCITRCGKWILYIVIEVFNTEDYGTWY